MSSEREEPLLTDEQILEFEQQIKDEEAQKVSLCLLCYIGITTHKYQKIPLVCQEEPISKLVDEFKENERSGLCR